MALIPNVEQNQIYGFGRYLLYCKSKRLHPRSPKYFKLRSHTTLFKRWFCFERVADNQLNRAAMRYLPAVRLTD
jgi:hypothetical protein